MVEVKNAREVLQSHVVVPINQIASEVVTLLVVVPNEMTVR